MPFTVASYNILANVYLLPERYPNVDPARLDPTWRLPALLSRVTALEADAICLQEVETTVFQALAQKLGEVGGYRGHLALKHGKKEGCALFVRSNVFTVRQERALPYRDGRNSPDTGNVALILLLEHAGQRLGIVSTHLTHWKWDPKETTPGDRRCLRQARQLVAELPSVDPTCSAWIVCGDFNAETDDDTVRVFRDAGYQDPFAPLPHEWTCGSEHGARRIDYLLYRGSLRAQPVVQPPLAVETPLPCLPEPSDHRPVVARFDVLP